MAPLLSADEKEFSEETRIVSPANFLIKIESFSLLRKNGIDKYESRTFDAGGHKWKIIIFPEGNKRDRTGESHVSVYLTMVETDSLPDGWEVNAIFTFFLHNQLQDYYHCFRGMTRRFNAVSNRWGFSKLMSKNELMDPSKGFLVEDCCVFGAEVYVVKNERVKERLRLVEDTSPYVREWQISNFSKLEDDVWTSEVFEVADYKWEVTVHPNGESSHSKDRYISIFVQCIDSKSFAPHEKLKAEVSIRIESKLNKATHHTLKFTHWFTSSSAAEPEGWGFEEFISKTDMKSKGFLDDDCCNLEVEISVKALAVDHLQLQKS